MLDEFKKFALKGNVVDMAVGVIIGGAFGKIVTSLVNDIIMPILGILTGGINLAEEKWVIRKATEQMPELTLNYGQFIQNIIDFLIISVSIFIVVKLFNKFRKKEQPKTPKEPKPTKEELLLAEIRDLLRDKQ